MRTVRSAVVLVSSLCLLAGSVLGGLAQSGWFLLLTRFVEGLGYPRELAMTPRHLYWVDAARGSIGRNRPERSRLAATNSAIWRPNCCAAAESPANGLTAIGSGSIPPRVMSSSRTARAGDASSAEDLTRAEIQGRRDCWTMFNRFKKSVPGFEDAYFIYSGPYIGIRETRRITGHYQLTRDDVLGCASFPDTIGVNGWPVEEHVAGNVEFRFQRKPRWFNQLPYRMLVPLGVENLLVAGRCASMTHGGQSAARVARWDGSQWHALGSGLDGPAYRLGTYQGDLVVVVEDEGVARPPEQGVVAELVRQAGMLVLAGDGEASKLRRQLHGADAGDVAARRPGADMAAVDDDDAAAVPLGELPGGGEPSATHLRHQSGLTLAELAGAHALDVEPEVELSTKTSSSPSGPASTL